MTFAHVLLVMFSLGIYHGINPAMGWLLAVSIGFQRKSLMALFYAIAALTLGHFLAVAVAVGIFAKLHEVLSSDILGWGVVMLLVLCGITHLVKHGHPSWFSMQSGYAAVSLWSFLIATGHGAGVMLLPFLFDGSRVIEKTASIIVTHTLGYFLAALSGALFIYWTMNLQFLKKTWINFDLIWAYSLILTGVFYAILLMI